MKKLLPLCTVAMVAVSTAGCSSNSLTSLLDDRSTASQTPAVQSYNDLTMPPDLQLPPPGAARTTTTTATTATAPPATGNSAVYGSGTTQTAAAQPEGDVFERNGISKVNADGTPKTDAQLQAELKQVYLAKKKQTNPGYGTIFNIGNIFDDG